jgi:hypothetical protein
MYPYEAGRSGERRSGVLSSRMSLGRDFHRSSQGSSREVQRLRMLPSRLYVDWTQGFVRKVGRLACQCRDWVLTSGPPVLDAFAASLKRVWLAMTVISAVGLLCSFFLKEIPMATATDEQWGVKEKKKKEDVENGEASTPRETTNA